MTMMGSSLAEVAAVSLPSKGDRIIGFSEEDQRARQRSGFAGGSDSLPKGNYIFCDFQTLQLPGVALNPPPAVALRIMHKLAGDRGIIAIMNKYRWRVGIMTEMAPIGYVGISPKCVLGFNKNRGQEISLRLRTDDLKGFRKYESIKKTLLHELAHMVHDEHDGKFHALDKKLNDEAIALDWTKSHGHTLSGVRFDDEEEDLMASSSVSARGYTLGGSTGHYVDARTAAAAAALRRLGDAAVVSPPRAVSSLSNPPKPEATPGVQSEPDPDQQDSNSVVVIASGTVGKDDALGDDVTVCVSVRSQEPDPDEHVEDMESDRHAALDVVLNSPTTSHIPDRNAASLGLSKNEPDPDDEASDFATAGPARSQEPDPDEAIETAVRSQEPDPDEAIETAVRSQEPDPDEAIETAVRSQEPDPDEASGAHHHSRNEPDPDEEMELDASVRKREPDPDEALGGHSGRNEPDPDEAVDMALDTLVVKQEPDPDEASGGHLCRNEPDPDESVGILVDAPPGRMQEPDPDEVLEADRDLDECVGCSRMAGKRMKSLTEGGFSSVGKPQT